TSDGILDYSRHAGAYIVDRADDNPRGRWKSYKHFDRHLHGIQIGDGNRPLHGGRGPASWRIYIDGNSRLPRRRIVDPHRLDGEDVGGVTALVFSIKKLRAEIGSLASRIRRGPAVPGVTAALILGHGLPLGRIAVRVG